MSKRGWPHVDDPVAVGTRLKEARLAAGMSQRELSFQGCTAVYICRIERGDRVPSLQVLRELARRLDVGEDFLATGAARVSEGDRLLEGDVALRLDELELAAQIYAEALAGTSNAAVRARALGGLGQVDLRAGRLSEAIERLQPACELLGERIAERPELVGALARAHSLRGEHEAAVALLEDALELARARRLDQSETRLTVLLADALIDEGSLHPAAELLGGTIDRAEGAGDPVGQARLHWGQSRLRAAEGNLDAANSSARMALAAIELSEQVETAATAHLLLARVERESGNPEAALALLDREGTWRRASAPRVAGSRWSGRTRWPRSAGTARPSSWRRRRATPSWSASRPRPGARTRSPPSSTHGRATGRARSRSTSEPPLSAPATRRSSAAFTPGWRSCSRPTAAPTRRSSC